MNIFYELTQIHNKHTPRRERDVIKRVGLETASDTARQAFNENEGHDKKQEREKGCAENEEEEFYEKETHYDAEAQSALDTDTCTGPLAELT